MFLDVSPRQNQSLLMMSGGTPGYGTPFSSTFLSNFTNLRLDDENESQEKSSEPENPETASALDKLKYVSKLYVRSQGRYENGDDSGDGSSEQEKDDEYSSEMSHGDFSIQDSKKQDFFFVFEQKSTKFERKLFGGYPFLNLIVDKKCDIAFEVLRPKEELFIDYEKPCKVFSPCLGELLGSFQQVCNRIYPSFLIRNGDNKPILLVEEPTFKMSPFYEFSNTVSFEIKSLKTFESVGTIDKHFGDSFSHSYPKSIHTCIHFPDMDASIKAVLLGLAIRIQFISGP